MAHSKGVKHGEILPPVRREVGVRLGDNVFVPALPTDGHHMRAVNGYFSDHMVGVSLIDQYFALRAQYAASRHVIWRPSVDVAAQEEEEAELKHQRKLSKLRRERELHEQKLAAMQAQHKLEAEEEFKPLKFAKGAARFAESTAKFRVGEAVAHASMQGGTQEPDQPAERLHGMPLVDALLQGIDDLERQIAEREASGQPAEALHGQRDALRELLMHELRKGR
jgi:hypothetical protein